MTTTERLKVYLDSKGINVFTVETTCGFANSTLNKAIKGNRSITSGNLEKILNAYPDLSAEWLLRGSGSMTVNDSFFIELEKRISMLASENKNRNKAYDVIISFTDAIIKTKDLYTSNSL